MSLSLRALAWLGIGLVALSTIGRAEEPVFDFGLTGRITIVKATEYMDGGSISVILEDEHGNTASAGYRSPWRHEGGEFTFRAPGTTVPKYLFSAHHAALLALVQAACVATYGTDDPQQLRAAKDWSRSTMGRFIVKLQPRVRAKPAPPAKSAP